MSKERSKDKVTWTCPVCKTSNNSNGEPFVSDWAVAMHIAGKGRFGDRLHKSWALSKVPNLDFKNTMIKIANYLEWPVVEAHKEQTMIEKTVQKGGEEPYEKIGGIERSLHGLIENILKKEFGDSEEGWWAKGIPLNIRKKCAERREEDIRREYYYAYTDLIDLKAILTDNWRLFENKFHLISKKCKSKSEFLGYLGKLNGIRNVIMHPVREQEHLSSEELQFLDFLDKIVEQLVSRD